MSECPSCGRPLEQHDRHVRFRLPDPVLATADQERAPGVWMSDDDPDRAVMMQFPEVGPFVRALLPVRLTAGYTVTYGVWVSISPDDLQRAFAAWWSPEYGRLELDGVLANSIGPWDVLRAQVHLKVRDPDHTPYCSTSDHSTLASVLTQEWDHDVVLATLP